MMYIIMEHCYSKNSATFSNGFLQYQKWVYYLLLLMILLQATHSGGTCQTGLANKTDSTCKLCFNEEKAFLNCTSFNSTSNISASIFVYSECKRECCTQQFSFAGQTQNKFCNRQSSNQDNNDELSSKSLTIVLTVVFFGVPVICCFTVAVCNCLYKRRIEQQRLQNEGRNQSQQPPIESAINLASFNLQQFGAIHISAMHQCTICLQEKCNIRTKCGHIYHSHCLKQWIKKKQKCPLCIGREFNPVVVYCRKCFTAKKLAVLAKNMTAAQRQQWRKLTQYECQQCISIQKEEKDSMLSIEEVSQTKKQVQKPKGMMKEELPDREKTISQSNLRLGQK